MLTNRGHAHLYGETCGDPAGLYPIATPEHRNYPVPDLHSTRPWTGRAALLSLIALAAPTAGCESDRDAAPSCSTVAAHVRALFGGETGDEYASEVRAVFAVRCSADQWAEPARGCLAATTSLEEPRGCKKHLSPPQIEALDRALADAERREQGRTIPAACRRYEAVLAVVGRCESFPLAARQELVQKFDAFQASWASVPDKRALEPTCASAIGAVKLAAAGCPGAATW